MGCSSRMKIQPTLQMFLKPIPASITVGQEYTAQLAHSSIPKNLLSAQGQPSPGHRVQVGVVVHPQVMPDQVKRPGSVISGIL